MPTIRNVQQFIQQGDYDFSIDQECLFTYSYCSASPFFYSLFGNTPYQWKVYPFGIATAPMFFTSLTKPVLFLYRCKGFYVNIHLGGILLLTCSKYAGKSTQHMLMYWFFLDYILIFQSMNLISLSTFLFRSMLGYSGHISIFTILQTS